VKEHFKNASDLFLAFEFKMSNWQNTARFLRDSLHILVCSGDWGGVVLYNEKSGNKTVIAPKRQDHNLGPTIVNLITLGFNLV